MLYRLANTDIDDLECLAFNEMHSDALFFALLSFLLLLLFCELICSAPTIAGANAGINVR